MRNVVLENVQAALLNGKEIRYTVTEGMIIFNPDGDLVLKTEQDLYSALHLVYGDGEEAKKSALTEVDLVLEGAVEHLDHDVPEGD